ncbi:MAG: hypothetical protein HQ567_07855, partial [Candidatus Nealsonbacteria bacterium]|nr:hypothetical protein [Candidatus Nealsonbacteria bacterium]
MAYLGNGGGWGNPAGGLIVSAAPLGTVDSDLIYTLSMMANGSALPTVLDLLADGVALTPTFSVDPVLSGDWQEFSRTYDATSLSGHAGESLTIVLGHGRSATGNQSRYDDVSLNTISELVWDNGNGNGNWGTANNWDPDPLIPTATTPAAINSGTPRVEADHAALSVRISGGELTIGAGNALTLTTGINSAGTVALENGSRLSTGSGSIAAATIDGRATIAVYADNNLDVTSLSAAPTKSAELVKEDAGTITLHAASLEASNLILAAGTMVVVGETDTDFTAAGDATLHLETASTANLGKLILESGTVTLTGAPDGITFTGTTVDAPGGGTVGFNHDVALQLNQIDVVSTGPVTISKGGQTDLVLTDASAGSGLQHATFEVRLGRLVGVQETVNPFGSGANAARLGINGGEIVLASRALAPGDVTYDNALSVVADGTLTAGTGDAGLPGPRTVTLGGTNGVTVSAGTLTLRSTDDYSLNVAGALEGTGTVEVTEGNVTLAGGGEIANLKISGGTAGTGASQVNLTDSLQIGTVTYSTDAGTFAAHSPDFSAQTNIIVSEPDSTLSISFFSSEGGVIPVPNGSFEEIYQPGSTTITADIGGGWTNGVGPDTAMESGQTAAYSDGTTGTVVDVPGWINTPGWPPSYTWPKGCGSIAGQGPAPDGVYYYTANGGEWGNGQGGAIESDAPLATVGGGVTYTVSMLANGPVTPVVLELLANGVALTPSSSVDPAAAPYTWEDEFSRTYDHASLTGHLGESLTIRVGFGPDALGTQSHLDVVSLNGVLDPAWPADLRETNLLVTANAKIASEAAFVTLGNLTVESGVTALDLQGAAYSFQDVSIAGGTTLDGEAEVRAAFEVGNDIAEMTLGNGELVFGGEAIFNAQVSLAAEEAPADKIVLTGAASLQLGGTLAVAGIDDRAANDFWADATRTIVDNTVGAAIGDAPSGFTFDTISPALAAPGEPGPHIGQGAFLRDVTYVNPTGFVVNSVELDLFIALGGDADGDGKVW